MDIQRVINSRLGVGAGYTFGRLLPPKYGYQAAEWLGKWLAGRKNLPMVKAVRTNQWVVSGGRLSGAQLDMAVQETYRNNARSIYELYRFLHEPDQIPRKLENIGSLLEIFSQMELEQRGLLALGVHMANFDLILRAGIRLALEKSTLKGIAISAPQPGKGYQWQNKYRETENFQIVPASRDAMKLGLARLEMGQVVLTGIDRPVTEDPKIKPAFFNRPSVLPVGHVSLALKSDATVIVFGAIAHPDGTYQVLVSDPVVMRSFPNHQDELRYNAEAILSVAEDYIRLAPQQWAMPYCVWPDVTRAMTG